MGNSPSNLAQQPQTIEQQASAATAQVNALIAQSNNALMCGPSCQREKQLSDLEEKYVGAKNNVRSAPTQLETAKKNYYLALEGQSGYNKMVLDTATKDAKKEINVLQTKFNETYKNVESLIVTHDSLTTNLNYMNALSQEYAVENIKMAKVLKKIRGDIITNDRKTYYEQQNVDHLEWWYNWFKILYIIFLIFLIIAVLLKVQGWIKKIFIILIFVLYPVFITPLVKYILKLIHSILSAILPKDVYLTI